VAAVMRARYRSVIDRERAMVRPRDVERYTSDYSAIVKSRPGARLPRGSALAVSSVPLRTAAAGGRKVPVDLSLRAVGRGLRPASPLVGFSLPGDLRDGVGLPGGVSLSVASGNPGGVAPSRVGSGTALYPGVDTDTDLLASSTPRGVELFRLMRSPRSPADQRLRLRLPKGDVLEPAPHGGAAVVRGGKPVLSIAAPTASDAQGQSVPVAMRVAGETLRLTVSRGTGDWAYPILVDPAIDGYASADFPGWVQFNNGNYSTSGDCMFGRECFGPSPNNYTGINIYAWQRQYYAAGAYAGFGYRAPADRSTYVARATLGWVGYYNGEPSRWISPYMYAGLWDWTYGQNAWQAVYYSWWAGTIDLVRLGDSPMVKEVNVQLNNTSAHTAGADHHAYVGAATVYLDDPDSPGFGYISRPPWVDQQPKPIPLTVSDAGLGISSLTVTQPGGPSWQTSVGCAGGNRNPCPRTWTSPDNGSPTYDPSALPQGINYLTVTATDAAGHVSPNAATAQVRVDHTDPTLSLSGALTNAAQLGPSRPRYGLHVDAKDGTSDAPQSGIASVAVRVDGQQVAEQKPSCTGNSCPLSWDWTLDASKYSAGRHAVAVTATDGVGRTATKTLDVDLARDTTKPGLVVLGPLAQAPKGWVDQHNYTATGVATDAGYGASSMKLLIDGKPVGAAATQTCPDGGCTLKHTFTANMANYTGGAHQASLVAYDAAGNTTIQAWTVNVNPDGNISTSEATSTLKAADTTNGQGTVAPTSQVVDAAETVEGNDPGLQQTGTALKSTGTPATSTMTTNPADGFTIQAPDDSIHVTPTQTSTSATTAGVASSVAAVSGNTASQVDTVVRPIFDGMMTFESIRDVTAPENFSWRVTLDADQTLKSVDDQTAEVYYDDGTPAMMISAQPAHDATGATVPTTLAVTSPDLITLTVSHQAGRFVYPVAAGPGWETGYISTAPGPPTATDTDPGDPINFADVDAPEVDRSLGSGWHRKHADAYVCDLLGCKQDRQDVLGYFRYNGRPGHDGGEAIRGTVDHPGIGCTASGVERTEYGHGRGWLGPNPAYYHTAGSGHSAQHLTMYCNFTLYPFGVIKNTGPETLWTHMYGDGYYRKSAFTESQYCSDIPYECN
jgi:hypothetical protein